MEQNFPKYIKNEKDLAVYENHLRKYTERKPQNQIKTYWKNLIDYIIIEIQKGFYGKIRA